MRARSIQLQLAGGSTQDFHKSMRVRRGFGYFARVDSTQNGEGVASLVVLALGPTIARGALHAPFQICLGHTLCFRALRKRIRIEPRAKVLSQSASVGQKPSLHALDHEMGVIPARAIGAMPAVALTQVAPRVRIHCNRPFAIHQKHHKIVVANPVEGAAKVFEGLLSASTGRDFGHPPFQPRTLEKLPKPLPAFRSQGLALTASLDIDHRAHQRFPPNSPFVQSVPRL